MTGGLAHPNGVALSPDGKRLWVSEHPANRLLALDLDESSIAINDWAPGAGVSVYANRAGGGLADSITVDADGNVYQAMYFGGRVEVFDKAGNTVTTRRHAGDGPEQFPTTSNVAIRPGTHEGYITAGGPEGISSPEVPGRSGGAAAGLGGLIRGVATGCDPVATPYRRRPAWVDRSARHVGTLGCRRPGTTVPPGGQVQAPACRRSRSSSTSLSASTHSSSSSVISGRPGRHSAIAR